MYDYYLYIYNIYITFWLKFAGKVVAIITADNYYYQ